MRWLGVPSQKRYLGSRDCWRSLRPERQPAPERGLTVLSVTGRLRKLLRAWAPSTLEALKLVGLGHMSTGLGCPWQPQASSQQAKISGT